LGDRILLQVDDEPDLVARGLVAEVGDALEAALLHLNQLGDLRGEARLVHLVRELRHDDARVALRALLDLAHCAHLDGALARRVRVVDPLPAHDQRPGREIGPGDVLHEDVEHLRLVAHKFVVLDDSEDPVDHLGEVVRRDVRRHPDRDAARAVDEKVREARR
jgi:hypothetical protein